MLKIFTQQGAVALQKLCYTILYNKFLIKG